MDHHLLSGIRRPGQVTRIFYCLRMGFRIKIARRINRRSHQHFPQSRLEPKKLLILCSILDNSLIYLYFPKIIWAPEEGLSHFP